MNENDELRAILGTMLLMIFPDRVKSIIKSLRIIMHEMDEILDKHEVGMTKNDLMDTIFSSLCFMAKNVKVDE